MIDFQLIINYLITNLLVFLYTFGKNQIKFSILKLSKMKKTTLLMSLISVSIYCSAQFNVSTVTSNDLYWDNGQIGIGLNNPTSKLDIALNTNFMYEDVSGFRLTYPIPGIGGPGIINENIFEIRQKTLNNNHSTKMVVKVNGNVGIGVQSNDPFLNNQRLVVTDRNPKQIDMHVIGFGLIDGQNGSLLLGSETGAPYGEWGIEYNDYGSIAGLNFWKPAGSNGFGNYFMFISDKGNVSIGTNDSKGYKFAVKGDMIAEKVVVKLHADWPDFVFAKKYGLMPLDEVETFIEKNHHLPNIPSAKEVEEKGIDLGEMNAALLQKVEELTLYVIELKKEIEDLKK